MAGKIVHKSLQLKVAQGKKPYLKVLDQLDRPLSQGAMINDLASNFHQQQIVEGLESIGLNEKQRMQSSQGLAWGSVLELVSDMAKILMGKSWEQLMITAFSLTGTQDLTSVNGFKWYS